MPNTPLQPGSTDTAAVRALQTYLVQNGYMTAEQMNSGPGIYGPQTTAAVAALQKDLGVDNSSGVGYFGPRTISAVAQKGSAAPAAAAQGNNPVKALQAQLGVPQTGVFDAATSTAMDSAVARSIASNPEIKAAVGNNDPAVVLAAYQSGDWSGVIGLSGKPFTDEQQQAAVAEAERVLGPAYQETAAYDRAGTEDVLRGAQEDFRQSQADDRQQFSADKDTLDQNAADQGVLFSGSRVQKLNDLRTSYADRERIARETASNKIGSTARAYQYNYGNEGASQLSKYYQLPGATGFNSNAAGGPTTPSRSLSAVYDPKQFSFQGTKPVAQKAATQVRAATQLANTANKLSLSGYGTKF